VSLIGLPPSGGFIAKWLITEGALEAGAWHWAGIVVLGTILSAGYFARVLAAFLRGGGAGHAMPGHSIPVRSAADGPPLALALAAVALGLAAAGPLDLLAIGSPFTKGDLL
jgi:multicomponent Na+:H+ antiporter subunit D